MTAVIFDCDGTLVDSEPAARAAWEETLARYGYAAVDGDFDVVTGLPFDRVHAYFAERAALPDPEPLYAEYTALVFARFEAALRPFPDATAAVHALAVRGVPLAVASSSRRARLNLALRLAGLTGFAATVAGDEVPNGKPAPDLYLAAAAALGARPRECVVVEDSPPGVAAAAAAGMAVLAVCREPGTEATLAAADAVVHEVTADAILALARPRRGAA